MTTIQAVKHFGNKKKLADALGIKKAAVSQWGKYPPARRQYQLQIITKNLLVANI